MGAAFWNYINSTSSLHFLTAERQMQREQTIHAKFATLRRSGRSIIIAKSYRRTRLPINGNNFRQPTRFGKLSACLHPARASKTECHRWLGAQRLPSGQPADGGVQVTERK